jgi:hypothetical protein
MRTKVLYLEGYIEGPPSNVEGSLTSGLRLSEPHLYHQGLRI